MTGPKILLTWSHLLLFLLHFAYAQPATEPGPSSPASASGHSRDLPNAVRIVVFICAFLIVGLFSAYLDYWTELYITSRNQTGGASVDWPWSCSQPRGIDRKILDTFPILVYSTIKDLKIGKGALECAVCLSEFKDYESLRMIPKCNHVFHPECIDVWLASHVTCPVCREKLNPGSGEVAIAVPTQLNAGVLEEGSAGRTRAELGESETEQHPQNEGQSRKDQNRRSKWSMFGKLPRSNSTGHSLVQSEKDLERHRLRLPEDVRKYILQNHGGIGSSASYNVVMPMVGKGTCGSDSEGSSRGKTSYIERQ